MQEQQSARPKHPRHGFYELDAIRDSLRGGGFTVTANLRGRDATHNSAADETVAKIRALLESGVRADRITVVGASMGAQIAMLTSARLASDDVRFVFLGPCASTSIPAVTRAENRAPKGRLLFIREESDVPGSECPAATGVRELVLRTGTGHGFLYRPMREWLEPVRSFASR